MQLLLFTSTSSISTNVIQEPLSAPPPAYNSLFDTAKSFPKNIRKNILGQSQSKNNHKVDGNESEEANAEENTHQNSDSDDEAPDTFCGCLFLIGECLYFELQYVY